MWGLAWVPGFGALALFTVVAVGVLWWYIRQVRHNLLASLAAPVQVSSSTGTWLMAALSAEEHAWMRDARTCRGSGQREVWPACGGATACAAPATRGAAAPLHIVIMVVGTRGDVQPAVALAAALTADGHAVRVATHEQYRDLVTGAGVPFFYPVGGDPEVLTEIAVASRGMLPVSFSAFLQVRREYRGVFASLLPAAVEPFHPGGSRRKPDLIITTPLVYGAAHVAEALRVPLHVTSAVPWVPSKYVVHPWARAFDRSLPDLAVEVVESIMPRGTPSPTVPLPLPPTTSNGPATTITHSPSNLSTTNTHSTNNKVTNNLNMRARAALWYASRRTATLEAVRSWATRVSTPLLDHLVWFGIADMLAVWRVRELGLWPLGGSNHGWCLYKCPTTLTFSPSLLPPAPDWPPHVAVTGPLLLSHAAALMSCSAQSRATTPQIVGGRVSRGVQPSSSSSSPTTSSPSTSSQISSPTLGSSSKHSKPSRSDSSSSSSPTYRTSSYYYPDTSLAAACSLPLPLLAAPPSTTFSDEPNAHGWQGHTQAAPLARAASAAAAGVVYAVQNECAPAGDMEEGTGDEVCVVRTQQEGRQKGSCGVDGLGGDQDTSNCQSGQNQQLPEDVALFLAAGPPPVYVGFGSALSPTGATQVVMATLTAAARTRTRILLHRRMCALQDLPTLYAQASAASSTAACDRAGEVISKSSTNSCTVSSTSCQAEPGCTVPQVHVVGDVLHSLLLPRCAGVMTHGGVGTVLAALAAGRPTLVCPVYGDNFFWGDLVAGCGAGPHPLPAHTLSAQQLEQALAHLKRPECADVAAQMADTLAAEHGLEHAVAHTYRFLLDPPQTPSSSSMAIATSPAAVYSAAHVCHSCCCTSSSGLKPMALGMYRAKKGGSSIRLEGLASTGGQEWRQGKGALGMSGDEMDVLMETARRRLCRFWYG